LTNRQDITSQGVKKRKAGAATKMTTAPALAVELGVLDPEAALGRESQAAQLAPVPNGNPAER
jgi:hypothetical protein